MRNIILEPLMKNSALSVKVAVVEVGASFI